MRFLTLLALLGLSSGIVSISTISAANPGITSYQKSDEDFPNPERGFFVSDLSKASSKPLDLSKLQSLRKNDITLVRQIYILPRDSVLSQSFLSLIKNNFDGARKARVKLILRFAYNWEWGGSDAPFERISSHLDQLKPILTGNKDVISFIEAGFMGYWGEWHHSKRNLENGKSRRKILFKILSILPDDRMVALRYHRDKIEVFNSSNPLTPSQAFNGSQQARTGAHNDCFVASNSDMNTYNWDDPNVREKERSYLNLDNRYVPQGGETCQTSKFDDCPNALKELARMRWSTINSEYEPNVLQGWKDQGCMNEIGRRLGYRFRLISSTTSKSVKPGGTFTMSFKVSNDGWASPYNPRKLEVILRNSKTKKEYYLPINKNVRLWMPGETEEVKIEGGVPADMPAGEYQILLNLPDPAPSLYKRPEYSIRLANKDVWEADTGYNFLLQSVNIEPDAPHDTYSGNQVFQSR